ncbi:ATP-binding protein [Streptomyces sp. NPDC003327]
MNLTVRRHCRLSGPGAPARAREEVHRLVDEALLAGWCVDRTAEDDTLLVVSELVTNAVRHAGGTCDLDLTLAQDDIDIGVTDPAVDGPVPRSPDRTGERGGFGWGLVVRLTHDLTISRDPGGKTIHVHVDTRH